LPFISLTDKAQIVGTSASDSAPPPRVFAGSGADGVPLFWQEQKPLGLWKALLEELDVKCVVDLSPGSGMCGRACLNLGIQWLGVTRSESHASWLQNVLDRQSLELVVKQESPLFEQDLSALIQKHFADVLEQLNEKDTADEETVPDAGQGAEGPESNYLGCASTPVQLI
jgi:hypothetical protein